MARLSFGFMVLLLTCAKIVSANDLPAQDELTEKLNLNGENDSTYTRTPPTIIEKANILPSVEQNEDLNTFAKRSIDYSRGNWLNNNNNNYNPPTRDTVAPDPYSLFSQWQPQSHQIDRPYYIPVLRGPGGSSIILPPQPLYITFAFPPDNPPKEGYLPPDNNPPPCKNMTLIINKYDDEAPVWDNKPVTKPVSPQNPQPTRIPGVRSTTPPSLIHNINDVDSKNELPKPTPAPITTTTTARSTTRPAPQKLPPSSCVWSIISCCNSKSRDINYRCFEQLGCEGAFWDGSPCDAQYAREAIETIMKYYETQ